MKKLLGILMSGALLLVAQTALAAPVFSPKDCDAFKTIAPFNQAETEPGGMHAYTDRLDCRWGYSIYDKAKEKSISNGITVLAYDYTRGRDGTYTGIGGHFLSNSLIEAFEQSRTKAANPVVCTDPDLDCVITSEGDGDTTYLIREDIRSSSWYRGTQSGYAARYGEMYRDFLITIYASEINEFGSVRHPDVLVESIAKTKSLIDERLGGDAKSADELATPTLTGAFGEVTIIRGFDVIPYREGMKIEKGDRISTSLDSGATIKLPDGSTIAVGELSDVALADYDKSGEGIVTRLWQTKGSLEADVRKRTLSTGFEVKTPTAVAGVRGTRFSVIYDETTGRTDVVVSRGSVAVTPEDNTFSFGADGNLALASKPRDAEPLVLEAGEAVQVSRDSVGEVTREESSTAALYAVAGIVLAILVLVGYAKRRQ